MIEKILKGSGVLVLGSGSLLSLYFCLKVYLARKKYAHIPGPPAKGISGFLFGNLSEMLAGFKAQKTYPELVLAWTEKYGNTFKVQILSTIVVFTIEPSAVKEILVDKDFDKESTIYKVVGFPINERLLGNGLLTSVKGEVWKPKRALFNPGFHRHVLMNFMADFNTKGDILLERLRSLADGKTYISLLRELNNAALDVIATIAFGMQTDSINHPENELNYFITESLAGLNKALYNPLYQLNPQNWAYLRKFKKVLKNLRMIGKTQIENRIKLMQEGLNVPNDLLSIFLETHANAAFNLEEMIDEFITFFVAGQETTSNTLAFCFLSLSSHPEYLKKMKDEVDRVLGSRIEIKYQDLNELKYTSCVIKETLRLYPPVAMMSRESNQRINIGGFDIPSGTFLSVSAFASGRSEQFYPNAQEFCPDRFLNNNHDENFQNYTYFPFSLGPRNCIGQNFAQMEMKTILAKLIQTFDFRLDPNQNLGIKQETTLRPFDGARCIVSCRND